MNKVPLFVTLGALLLLGLASSTAKEMAPKAEPTDEYYTIASAIHTARTSLQQQAFDRWTIDRKEYSTTFHLPDGRVLQVIFDPGYPPHENMYQWEKFEVIVYYPPPG